MFYLIYTYSFYCFRCRGVYFSLVFPASYYLSIMSLYVLFLSLHDAVNLFKNQTDLPVSNAAGAQQQLSVAPPLSLQNNVNVKLFIVYENMLHATMEAVQLGLTLPYCVVGFRASWN